MADELDSIGLSLSENLETEGFDLQAGQTWIYPTNLPIREYQYNIVQQALFKNTLVSLPTGLGKTFIAAVVMYNFFRWYPLGKVIFMAPTRPLVKQQIEACYNIMGIPKETTVELTGTKLSTSREEIWNQKRVFFITPQILQNDLDKIVGFHQKIKCLVFDEAHRAKGNHAYCEVIRKLIPHNKYFRVLALSATPGGNISDVLEVVKNLLISHLEFRTEESLDVHPYVFERNLTTIVVPLGEKLQQIRDDYMQILEYYTKTLVKYKVIQGNCGNLTKGKIFMTLKEFQQRSCQSRAPNYAEILKTLNVCVTLYHGFELLIRHGLRSFLSFFEEHISKPLLKGNSYLIKIMDDIKEYLGEPLPVVEQLPDGSFADVPSNIRYGHPKFYKLQEILVSYFTEESGSGSSRVIVFFEYRNSVMEAYTLLNQSRPLLKPRIFLGQGRGVTQRQQLGVIKSFREGQCNILLSTCIGEEGLDVGDVDLIICFDISNKSPIRMVQRMGRTGRRKEGRIVVLVTEGKEQQILKDCLIHKNNIAFHVLSSKELAKGLITDSPRLVPPAVEPNCNKMYITIKKVVTNQKPPKKMFQNISNGSPQFCPSIQNVDVLDKIPCPRNLWNVKNPLDKNVLISNVTLKSIEKQRNFHPVHMVEHSSSTKLLVKVLQHLDSKRFNIPIIQTSGNILTLQMDSISSKDDLFFDSKDVLVAISNYLSLYVLGSKKLCKHCPNNFDCTNHCCALHTKKIRWNERDESVFKDITLDHLNIFSGTHTTKSKANIENYSINKTDISIHRNQDRMTEHVLISRFENVEAPVSTEPNMDGSMVTDTSPVEMSFTYLAPRSLNNILNKYYTNVDDFPNEQVENKSISGNKSKFDVDYGLLRFFKLQSLEELFDSTSSNVFQICDKSSVESIENSSNPTELNNSSPILHASDPVRNMSQTRSQILRSLKNSEAPSKLTLNDQPMDTFKNGNTEIESDSNCHLETTNCELYRNHEELERDSNSSLEQLDQNKICIDDICDLSTFGLVRTPRFESCLETTNTPRPGTSNIRGDDLGETDINVDEVCDLRIFGIESITNSDHLGRNDSVEKHLNDINKTEDTVNSIVVHNSHVEQSAGKDDVVFNTSIRNFAGCRKPLKPISQTQVSITQIIKLVNTDESICKTALKHNLNKENSKSNLLNKCETLKKLSDTEHTGKFKNPIKSHDKGSVMKKKKPINPFIEYEAEVSSSEENTSEDEHNCDQDDLYETSFVDDETQNVCTQMHVEYLRSIKSPKKQGNFKIPHKAKCPVNISDVYHEVDRTYDTYLHDSFVVDDETEEAEQELSELEILEKKLRLIKKKKKCNDASNSNIRSNKRRRIITSDDSD
ncbi:hypothetical protein NQ315_015252 [Exocentrus adspersus]|uniref:Fanconi anemia group M protein n=1 Tax=Exocentrus adspersus TaxID=1586481 RepID=A0AAV8V9Y5_9CUCU|nr:hypothetical protein NQ315_015252 [Exocentrus adspersus]